MLDTQLGGGFLKKSRDAPSAVGKAAGKLKAVFGLEAFRPDTPAGVPLHHLFQKAGGGASGRLRAGGRKAEPGEVVNGGVLERALRPLGTAALFQAVPRLRRTGPWISPAHTWVSFGSALVCWFGWL